MNAVNATNLSVSYDGEQIIHSVDLKVSAGEFLVIIGKSGSGKTTLLHGLAGLIAYEGKIERPNRVGLVLQQSALFPWLTVEDNIAFGLNYMPYKDRIMAVEEHLNLTNLWAKRDSYPNQLSGGQIQRVALARSMVPNPNLLLMDEPYGALDAYTRAHMQKWLMTVWEKHKKTVIFVTHDIEEAVFLADRVLVLDQGKFIEEINIPFTRPRLEPLRFEAEFNKLKAKLTQALR